MKKTFRVNSEALLREILAKRPSASLEDIRNAHPVFRALSRDHLSVRLTRLIEQSRLSTAK